MVMRVLLSGYEVSVGKVYKTFIVSRARTGTPGLNTQRFQVIRKVKALACKLIGGNCDSTPIAGIFSYLALLSGGVKRGKDEDTLRGRLACAGRLGTTREIDCRDDDYHR